MRVTVRIVNRQIQKNQLECVCFLITCIQEHIYTEGTRFYPAEAMDYRTEYGERCVVRLGWNAERYSVKQGQKKMVGLCEARRDRSRGKTLMPAKPGLVSAEEARTSSDKTKFLAGRPSGEPDPSFCEDSRILH